MTEEIVKEKKFVTVTFPSRQWTMKECFAFEEFVRLNGPELNRIFTKYKVMTTNFA